MISELPTEPAPRPGMSAEAYRATVRAIESTDDPRQLGAIAASLARAYASDPSAAKLLYLIERKLVQLRWDA